MLVGIVACALHFAYEYSVLQLVEFSVVPSRSHIMLPLHHQQVLALFQPNLVAVSVSGLHLPSAHPTHLPVKRVRGSLHHWSLPILWQPPDASCNSYR